ncbi:MAG: NAD(P)H-dependent glycerol-3-phosphate dehydrogenase [Geminicoccaceae bacterium]
MVGIDTVAVVGAGAWGTALALAAARAGRRVVLYARDPEVVASIASRRIHPRFPDIPLDPAIRASSALEDALAADAVLLAIPAQTLRAVCRELSGPGAPLLICAKGLESARGVRLSEVAADECPGRAVAVLSGPNFAAEIARGLPAATTLACTDAELGRRLAEALSGPGFRVYWTDDLIGVEIGGALKNVLAIAAGMVAGRGLGENARAAIITRGLAELGRLGEALGARRETLAGLAGMGDLVLSATSPTSRNMACGHAIGSGADPKALRAAPGALVEGIFTAGAAVRLAARHGIEVPISAAVDAILEGRMTVDAALEALMSRPLRTEAEGSR